MSSLIEICLMLVATKAGHTQCNVVTRDEHQHWDQCIMRAVICQEKETVVTRIHSSALKNDMIVSHLIANVSNTNYLE
jgi:DNA topoisomerase VI subunit A